MATLGDGELGGLVPVGDGATTSGNGESAKMIQCGPTGAVRRGC